MNDPEHIINPIIEYKNLVNIHKSIDAPKVTSFYKKYKDNPDFIRRADIFNELFILKNELSVISDAEYQQSSTKNKFELLDLIKEEIIRQDQKWGDQRNNSDLEFLAILSEEFGEVGTDVTVSSVPPIDDKEAKKAKENLKKELIQVSAVCIQWLYSIRQRELFDDSDEAAL